MKRRGLYISPTEFRSFAAMDKTRSLSDEIATRQRSIDFYSIGMYLPNPDPVLKKMGKDIAVYKELLKDPVVRGCVASRKARTKSLLWEIDRGKSKSRKAKFITAVFNELPVRRIINQILNAPLFGYQVFELMWSQDWTPDDIVAKPPQWFVFDEHNKLRFRTKKDAFLGEELPEKKFLLATNDADYENPYGDAILSSCFWPVTFRKGGYKFWITFTEKFGMPFIVGKQPRGIVKEETEAFADVLEAMVQDAIAVIPDDASVEIPETKQTGSADLYAKLIDACRGEINTALLGHSAGAASTPGRLGGENTAEGTGENLGDDDARLCEDVMNEVIDRVCDYHFADEGENPRFILYEEEDVDEILAQRDEKLVTALAGSKMRLTKKYFQKGYALEDEDLEDKPEEDPGIQQTVGGIQGKVPAEFAAAAGRDELDDALDGIPPEELQAQMEGVLKPVIDLINNGSRYEEIMKNLVEAYPKMDTAAIEEMLARAIFVSEAWGRLTAEK